MDLIAKVHTFAFLLAHYNQNGCAHHSGATKAFRVSAGAKETAPLMKYRELWSFGCQRLYGDEEKPINLL